MKLLIKFLLWVRKKRYRNFDWDNTPSVPKGDFRV